MFNIRKTYKASALQSYSVLCGLDSYFVPIFRLNLPSDESLLLIFDPAGAFDVVWLIHSIQALFLCGNQEWHGVHIVPAFPFIHRHGCCCCHRHTPTKQLTSSLTSWLLQREAEWWRESRNEGVNSSERNDNSLYYQQDPMFDSSTYSPTQDAEVCCYVLRPNCYISGLLLPDMVTTLKSAITLRSHPSDLPAPTTDSTGSGNSSICLPPFKVSLESHHSG